MFIQTEGGSVTTLPETCFFSTLKQAEFSEINVTAQANGTCNVSMQVFRNGAKVMR